MSNLERLADYFTKTTKDAEGYFKNDPEALAQALEALAYRERVARSLLSALRALEE